MFKRRNGGITLIVLVLTIIILLILAGISIMSLTNTGIFGKAQESKEKTEQAQRKEEETLSKYQSELNRTTMQADGSWNSKQKVNSPKLMQGMTGIYWDENGNEIEVTPDNIDNWYDYQDKKWANAITKDNEGNITGYWVWIPRYAYEIESGCYTSTAGKISIKFLQGTTNKDSEGNEISTTYPEVTNGKMQDYVVHPSFTDGTENNFMNGEWDKELLGYWVAKYAAGFQECTQTISSDGTVTEPTTNLENVKYSDKYYSIYHSSFPTNALSQKLTETDYKNEKLSYPVFKPLTYAYNVISTGDAYTISQEIAKASDFYGLNQSETDSHQMKNSEWGAVVYLAQSVYGVNSQVKIEANKKNLNNLNGKIIYEVTGYAGTTANGVAASTTNNMTGVFDMSGCVWERTAAYISNGNGSLSNGKSYANTTANPEGYKTLSTKYITVYPYDIDGYTGNAYDSEKGKNYGFGDAILEISNRITGEKGWNGDYFSFPYAGSPFFEHGGYGGVGDFVGIFALENTVGNPYYYHGFRSVLVTL